MWQTLTFLPPRLSLGFQLRSSSKAVRGSCSLPVPIRPFCSANGVTAISADAVASSRPQLLCVLRGSFFAFSEGWGWGRRVLSW